MSSTPQPTTASTATTTAAAPICTDGVSTSAIKRFMSQIKDYHPNNYEEVTTYDASVKPVIHKTKEWRCSYIDLLRRTKPEEVGPATVFVSHAWQYKISDVLTTMLEYAEEEEERKHKDEDGTKHSKQETFFWFDLFYNNQHKEALQGLTPEQIGAPFKSAIASIGKVLLVLTPWNNPVALARAWCLWEIFCAISQESDVGLEIRLPQHQRMELREAVLEDHRAITNMLVEVQAEKARATVPADKGMIFQAIETSVGFAEVNKAVKGQMRAWCLMMARSFVEEMEMGGKDSSAEFARMCNRIGLVMESFGEHERAEQLLQRGLGVELEMLGEKHPDTATTYGNLGGVYKSKGEYDRALEYCKKCLHIRLDTLGDKHPDTAATYNNLGGVYKSKDDYDRAIHYYEECLQIQLDTLGEKHLPTATTYNNLGQVYKNKGEYDRALEYCKKCLQIRLDTLGEKHPDTATTYNNLGGLYYRKDEYARAKQLMQRAVDILMDTLGPDHPHTKDGQQNLLALRLQEFIRQASQHQSPPTPSAQQRQLPTQRNLLLRFMSAQVAHQSSAARRNLILRFLCSALHAHTSPASAGRD
ncbi:mbre TPR repeat protein [Salpingoeca rosetta]|uniref:Mbre TPR repeat protein n=1 Tax=Salpingoeca rosetta (strain ATCC 50818 / BSB-021) TaxID=946362 RepID=F2UMZ1_SALR5|nr:mbre TPR repeat protein [Salpingoeca rosetta]EGD78490.1 mbre TPR repeat protein [Salpingoeca rosetta]|eukprot:XP_004989439.1 mbre TPR repeat protein [Salpingoeca rosetta]